MISFTPFIKTSTNVMSDLLNAANDLGISADAVDFDLLSCDTFFKGTVDEEWQRMEGDDLLSQTTEIEIRSTAFLLRQEYQIRIRPFTPHPYLDLRFGIATDKFKSKVIAIIDPTSVIPLKQGVQEWLDEAIRKKQLRHGLLIGIGDGELKRAINRFLLKIQKEGPLVSPYRLPVAECFPPTPATDDKVVLHYKNRKKQNSLIEGVQPGDLILEYVFPQNGRDGRGCDGKHIAIPDPVSKHAGLIIVDEETIESKQDEASIRYYARISGYIERKKGVFAISQELRIESASFRQTGSIEAGIDKDISLMVKKKNSSEDSIGTGVNIDVQKLDVSGTVGANAKIQACELTIGAQTHKKTQINVTEVANIHLHRGNLTAKEANIEILEAGRVEADIVRIKKMVGGEIVARIVEIEVLYSNARITALESIEIQTIEGDGNNLIIDPHAIQSYHARIEALEQEIRSKTVDLQSRNKEFSAKQLSFKEKFDRIKQFQERIANAKQEGAEPMKADLVRVQQYKIEVENLRTQREALQIDEEQLQTLHAELNKLYDAHMHAVITHRGIYNGHTRILFIDPKTRREYAISPEGTVTHIRLRRDGDELRLLLES